ncbi:MAG TPA: glycoside hydrolase domain-containing protein, partial [Acidimicrobiia bacterium]
MRVAVPEDWPVYDLATDPQRCVRTDRHAVYLGNAGTSPDCPTQVVGRVETVQIEPLDERTRQGAVLATAPIEVNGVPVELDPAVDTTHAIVAVLPDDRVVVTITFESDRGVAEQILHSLERTAPPIGPGVEGSGEVSCAALGCPNNPGFVYTGLGFDACSAPTTSQMSAWLASPFRAIGIYIGGANRGCSQPNLTASWVATVLNQGWKLIPIYVGLQASCSTLSAAKIDPANAGAQGAA